MNNRVLRFYNLWYKKPRYHMSWQDWLYCGLVIWLSTMGFALGLIIGLIWTLFL